MPFYEHVFLARQDLTTAQVEALTEGFTRVLIDNKGSVAGTEYWGLRTLAYRIAKNRKAHYVMLTIDAPPAALAEMERQVGLNEDVVRSMTIRIDALPTEPSAMTRRGGEREGGREDRPRGDRDGPRGDRGDRGDRGGDRGGERPRREPRAAY
ncbi:30S ribosomal protein S6 [Sandarakinorhabdus sp.]|uniref:30S ribosomal protein S6 n=1 Tax=Sandarakinorhabdus sp. TaxID=1916663 RepID=UPI003F724D84